jgi:dipeptidase E
MKLYLGSKYIQFPTALSTLVDAPPKTAVVYVVVNAFDNYPDERRKIHIQTMLSSLAEIGYSYKMLDLREFVNKKSDLKKLLLDADLLWVSGGNVFYLRYILQQSGLDDILPMLLKNGLTYGGDSAGAAVLGPNLRGLDMLDDPTEAPDTLFEGLGITPFVILPHWGNEKYKNEIGDANKELSKWNKEIVKISDTQACVVDGDEIVIHGEQTADLLG